MTYVIIGTAAVKNPGFLHEACAAFPGHVLVSLDAKDGKIAVDGWSKMTGHEVLDLGKKFQDYGVEAIIYTDIGRDGMMTGVNIDATVALAHELAVPGDRERRPEQPGRHPGAVRASRTKASPPPSPAARSTKARSISPRRRSWRTSCHEQQRLKDDGIGSEPGRQPRFFRAASLPNPRS